MPAKATAGSAPERRRGQPVDEQVDHELGALRLGLRVVGLAEQDLQHPGRDVGQHEPGADGVGGLPSWNVHLGAGVAAPDRADADDGEDLRAGLAGRTGPVRPETAPMPPTGSLAGPLPIPW